MKASWHRRLWQDRRGQGSVEFMVMMIIILFVMMAFVSISFLGSDMLTVRYASYVGARGYLVREPLWQDGAKQIGKLVVQNTGNMRGRPACGDQGISWAVQVKEFIPLPILWGDEGKSWLERETCLKAREPRESGDNVAYWNPGS